MLLIGDEEKHRIRASAVTTCARKEMIVVRFHNRWIDPRITQLRPEAAQAYLVNHGWKLLGPAINPSMLLFEAPGERRETTTVLLPMKTDDGSLLQRMIDLVAELSRFEDRWAVDVLSDILRQPCESVPANGPIMPLSAEPTPK